MPTSVVTGGAGFLGSHLCDYLIDKGHRVICVDNLETGSLENIEHREGDEFVFRYHDVIDPIWIDDPQVRRPDITRAQQILGWEPEIDLEEGLRRWLEALGYEPVGVK